MEHKPKKDLVKGHLGKDKKLKSKIIETSKLGKDFQRALKTNDMLLKESGGYIEADEGEDLLRLRQKDLKPLLPIANVNQVFDLDLEFGFYNIDFTRNGKYLLLAGSKGHVAMLEWKDKKLKTEFNVQDKIRDIKFLHNENLFAVAQEKHLYIYDNNGTEVHRLKTHPEPTHLEFLPYHFLLAAMSKEGLLIYQDVSTGKLVAEHKTKIKESGCMSLNPYNAMVMIGDPRGQVSMWCPNTGVPVVKMLCHNGSVNSLAVDNQGRHMVTAGTDGKMKVWDVRTYKMIFEYWNPTPAQNLAISQKGLLAVGLANETQLWKDWYVQKQKKPYLRQETYKGKLLNDLQFVPYEDFLGIGLKDGFSSIVIPGAGEVSFDNFEVNPYQTKKQRNNQEVIQLLDKLPPESITLDPTIIGTIDKASRDVIQAEKKVEEDEEERKKSLNRKKREKMRGRSSTKEKYVQKESVHDAKTREKLREIMNNRLKLKQIEKKKLLHERQLIQDDELLDNFDPVVALKKQKN